MAALKTLIELRCFDLVITALIVVNAVTLGLETSPAAVAAFGPLLAVIDRAILGAFVVELLARAIVYRTAFFRDPWRIFDLVVVAFALIPATGALSVLRALRILRVLRLISIIPSLRRVVTGFIKALPGMGSIMLLLGLVFYVFAVMATKLYGEAFPKLFGGLPELLYTLFQIMTLEGWSDGIVRPVMEVHPGAWLFFIPFIIATSFTVLNLFIGVIVSAMEAEHDEVEFRRAGGAAKRPGHHPDRDPGAAPGSAAAGQGPGIEVVTPASKQLWRLTRFHGIRRWLICGEPFRGRGSCRNGPTNPRGPVRKHDPSRKYQQAERQADRLHRGVGRAPEGREGRPRRPQRRRQDDAVPHDHRRGAARRGPGRRSIAASPSAISARMSATCPAAAPCPRSWTAPARSAPLRPRWRELEAAMGDPDRADEMDEIIARYGEVQGRFEELDGYALDGRAREVLDGLGFSQEMMDGDVGALSGGWKMRVALARILLMRPDAMLLDEPSNHLDLESLIWLEDFLKGYDGALLMTSHDREFMNRIVNKIVEIDGGSLTAYSGNYEFYQQQRAIAEKQQQAQFERQQAMLAKEIAFIERFKARASHAAQVQSRVKKLDKIDRVEPPKRRQTVSFEFQPAPRSGEDVVDAEERPQALWQPHDL